eukprot:2230382-Amphidinium_carterae.2
MAGSLLVSQVSAAFTKVTTLEDHLRAPIPIHHYVHTNRVQKKALKSRTADKTKHKFFEKGPSQEHSRPDPPARLPGLALRPPDRPSYRMPCFT